MASNVRLNSRCGYRVFVGEAVQRTTTACWASAEDPQFLPAKDNKQHCGEEEKRGEGGVGGWSVGVRTVYVPQSHGKGVLRDVRSEAKDEREGGNGTNRLLVWRETKPRGKGGAAVLGAPSSVCSSPRWEQECYVSDSSKGGKEQGAFFLLLSSAPRAEERPERAMQLLPMGRVEVFLVILDVCSTRFPCR